MEGEARSHQEGVRTKESEVRSLECEVRTQKGGDPESGVKWGRQRLGVGTRESGVWREKSRVRSQMRNMKEFIKNRS